MMLKPPEVNPRGSNEPRFNPSFRSAKRAKRKSRRARRGKR